MNSVPIEFSTQVLIMYNCCDVSRLECRCAKPLFVDPKWNKKEQLRAHFSLGTVNGKLKYGFCNPDYGNEVLTIDQLVRCSDVASMTLLSISIVEIANELDHLWLKYDVVDIKKLLHFVSSRSNECHLCLGQSQFAGCREGPVIVRWLEGSWFSRILIEDLRPAYHKILENQFSGWKPTMIELGTVPQSALFLENRLMSGVIKHLIVRHSYAFHSRVLSRIIQNILDDPERCRTLHIQARFEDTANELIDMLARSKVGKYDVFGSLKITFLDPSLIFHVQKQGRGFWRISHCQIF